LKNSGNIAGPPLHYMPNNTSENTSQIPKNTYAAGVGPPDLGRAKLHNIN
jgi:hypothetical protein